MAIVITFFILFFILIFILILFYYKLLILSAHQTHSKLVDVFFIYVYLNEKGQIICNSFSACVYLIMIMMLMMFLHLYHFVIIFIAISIVSPFGSVG